MLKIKRWKKIYIDKPSPVYFIFDNEDGKLENKTYGYGKIIYPEGSIYEGNLYYFNNQFHKYGMGSQYFKNTKISYEEFGGPKGLFIDRFVGNFNHLETNWIYGDGILYFVDKNNNPKAFIKGFFRCLTKIDSYKSKFDESLLIDGYSLDMEVEQMLHQSRFSYLLDKVKDISKVDTVLLGDSWFEMYEMPYYKNNHIYGSFIEDTKDKSVLNLGIGGSTYLEWLNKIDKLLNKISFNKIFINLGFNDIHGLGVNADSSYILSNLMKLEEKIRMINKDCEIFYLGVCPSCSTAYLDKKLEFSKMVEEYCLKDSKRHFISTKEIFLDGIKYRDDFEHMFIENDGNHLNEYGYQKWAKLFKDLL